MQEILKHHINNLFSNKITSVPYTNQGGSGCAKPLRVCSFNNAPGIQPIAFVGAVERGEASREMK